MMVIVAIKYLINLKNVYYYIAISSSGDNGDGNQIFYKCNTNIL